MSDPDRTSKLSRTHRGLFATGRSTTALRFPWPAPPYWEFAEDPGERPQNEECLLSFKDGEKATGLLLDFVPDAETLKFRQAKARGTVTIAFADLQGVHLLRPVKMQRQTVSLGGEQVFDASDRQSFNVQLASGSNLEGETVGHVHALCGLFLYLPEPDGTVIRCFVPARAATDSRIGKPLGEMLVDENLASADDVGAALEKQKSLRTRKLGEYLTANQIVSPEQLAAALKHQSAQPVQKLGETLVELGYLTDAELQEALAIEARDRSVPLGQILADMGVLDAEVVNGVMARKLGIPFVSLKSFRVAPGVLKRLPAAVAHRYQVLPLAEADNALVVALENPMNMEKMDELRFVAGTKLAPVMAAARDIADALERFYGPARDPELAARRAGMDIAVGELTHRLASESGEADAAESQAVEIDSTLVKLVNKIILDAVEQKASDIHIEANPAAQGPARALPQGRGAGALTSRLPSQFRNAVVSRIKIMSQLDITERRKPQDGKIDFSRFGPAAGRAARRHHPDRERPGGRRDARACRRQRRCRSTSSASSRRRSPCDQAADRPGRTACSWSAARPARARPPRCIPLLALPQYRGAQDLDRRRSDRDHAAGAAPGAGATPRSAGPSPPRCAASCAPIPT